MALVADDPKEEIRDKTDIVELVREYIPGLKQKGRGFWARCPFHDEKSASFQVNQERQIYHCFGCGKGGDIYRFVMELEGLSFPEALEKLGERVGVQVKRQPRAISAQDKKRLKAKESLESAREYYHRVLMDRPEAKSGLDYFKRRGLKKETVEAFKLGFRPRRGGLLAAAAKKGIDSSILLDAGLAAERKGSIKEFFWDERVIFPIHNAKGETIGFGGRTLGADEPKYVNSSESLFFSKRKSLYAIEKALPAMRKSRRALLLEGYMDVIAAHQFGFTNACAPLGTALTEDHVAILKRYVDEITIVFDADAAGAAAALRGAEMTLLQGVGVSVATVPGAKDPDELLQAEGAGAFQKAIDEAEDLAAFKTRVLLKGRKGELPSSEKARIASDVLSTIRKCQDEVLRSEWLRQLAETLRIDEASLRRQLERGEDAPPQRRPARDAIEKAAGAPIPVIDRDVLACLVREPGLAASEEVRVSEDDFDDPRAKEIFIKIRTALAEAENAASWHHRVEETLGPAEAALLRDLLNDERAIEKPAEALSDLVGRRRKKRRLAEIEPLVLKMIDGEIPRDEEIHKEFRRLQAELRGSRG
jgi:DNA primase